MDRLTLRLWMVALLGALLLSSAAALAGPEKSSAYVIEQGTASGGGYALAAGTWQIAGTSSGGGISLQPAGGSILQGAGCCCTYLPCLFRQH